MEDFGTSVAEAIRAWFENEYPEGLTNAMESEQKYGKKYFDEIEKDMTKEVTTL